MLEQALVFTDVVDSTDFVQRLGDARAAEVWDAHDRAARGLLRLHRGREIDRADGFFLLFDDVAPAARFALDYHAALGRIGLTARVGLHVGAVTLRHTAAADVARGAKPIEVDGLAKPFAARLMALASAGQTLVSTAARTALGSVVDLHDVRLESHGHYVLKGVEDPVEVHEMAFAGTSSFAPPADRAKAYRVVRDSDVWLPVRAVRHNLAAERDAFVGRKADLRALAEHLDAGTRLVTLLGAGGCGKTRLARRYARAWLGDWPGGAYFCDLAEAGSLDGIVYAVAGTLDVPLGGGDPVLKLAHAIAGRGRCLIVLDNFEQVAAHAAATLGTWLDRTVDAAFVVTSRARLQLPGEVILAVEPLPLETDAIALLTARAQAQRSDFVVNASNRAAVAEVVRLLDGLPLAIELAAARLRVLSPAQLVERMRDRFQLLSGLAGAAARQATLKATIDWSWELLAPWEQAALAQCSVFEGGITLTAAEEVLDLADWSEAPQAMDAVQALVDQSLLHRWTSPTAAGRPDIDEPRFGLYASIHDYARLKLQAAVSAAATAVVLRHGRHFAEFGSTESLEALSHHDGVTRWHRMALELDNLVAACRRAVAIADAEIAVATYLAAWEVLQLRGPWQLGVELGNQVCAVPCVSDVRSDALCTYGVALYRVGRHAEARAVLEQALAVAQQHGDHRAAGAAYYQLGKLDQLQGRPDAARTGLHAALAAHRASGVRRGEGLAIASLAAIEHEQGNGAAAQRQYEAALRIFRELGSRRDEGRMVGNLGVLLHQQGQTEAARAHYEAALAIYRDTGSRDLEAGALNDLGWLEAGQGRLEEAERWYSAALQAGRELGDRSLEGRTLESLGDLELRQGRNAAALTSFEQALAIGRDAGNWRSECGALYGIGSVLLAEQRPDEALERLRQAETLLRRSVGGGELYIVVCTRGLADCLLGNRDAALAALGEAQSGAQRIGAGPDSELGGKLAALRAALG